MPRSWSNIGSLDLGVGGRHVFSKQIKGAGDWGNSLRFGARLDGAGALHAKLQGASRALMLDLRTVVLSHATVILRRADKLVPMDTGKLRKTGRIEGASIMNFESVANSSRTNMSIGIAYGDATAKYALPVHERTELRHGRAYNIAMALSRSKGAIRTTGFKVEKLRRPQEQALWLEQAYIEHGPQFINKVEKSFRDFAARGFKPTFANTLKSTAGLDFNSFTRRGGFYSG